jgi:hypothetical protein
MNNVHGIVKYGQEHSGSFNETNNATYISCIAKITKRKKYPIDKTDFETIDKFIESNVLKKIQNKNSYFRARSFATIVHCISTTKIYPRNKTLDLFSKFCNENVLVKLIRDGNSQYIANVVNSYARWEHKCDNLFIDMIGKNQYQVLDRLIRDGSPQAIANVMNAYAKLGYKCDNLFIDKIGKNQNKVLDRLIRDGNS